MQGNPVEEGQMVRDFDGDTDGDSDGEVVGESSASSAAPEAPVSSATPAAAPVGVVGAIFDPESPAVAASSPDTGLAVVLGRGEDKALHAEAHGGVPRLPDELRRRLRRRHEDLKPHTVQTAWGDVRQARKRGSSVTINTS